MDANFGTDPDAARPASLAVDAASFVPRASATDRGPEVLLRRCESENDLYKVQ